MPKQQHHIIQKVTLKVEVGQQDGAYDLQSKILDLINTKVVEELGQMFDSMVAGDELIQIDQLQLDLGTFSSSAVLTEMPSVFVAQVSEAIHKALSLSGQQKTTLVSRIDRPRAELEIISDFLRFGQLDWPLMDGEVALSKVLDTRLKETPAGVRAMLMEAAQSPMGLMRLVLQFDAPLLETLIQGLSPQLAAWISPLHQAVDQALNIGKPFPQSRQRRKGIVLHFLLSAALVRGSRAATAMMGSPSPERVREALLKHLADPGWQPNIDLKSKIADLPRADQLSLMTWLATGKVTVGGATLETIDTGKAKEITLRAIAETIDTAVSNSWEEYLQASNGYSLSIAPVLQLFAGELDAMLKPLDEFERITLLKTFDRDFLARLTMETLPEEFAGIHRNFSQDLPTNLAAPDGSTKNENPEHQHFPEKMLPRNEDAGKLHESQPSKKDLGESLKSDIYSKGKRETLKTDETLDLVSTAEVPENRKENEGDAPEILHPVKDNQASLDESPIDGELEIPGLPDEAGVSGREDLEESLHLELNSKLKLEILQGEEKPGLVSTSEPKQETLLRDENLDLVSAAETPENRKNSEPDAPENLLPVGENLASLDAGKIDAELKTPTLLDLDAAASGKDQEEEVADEGKSQVAEPDGHLKKGNEGKLAAISDARLHATNQESEILQQSSEFASEALESQPLEHPLSAANQHPANSPHLPGLENGAENEVKKLETRPISMDLEPPLLDAPPFKYPADLSRKIPSQSPPVSLASTWRKDGFQYVENAGLVLLNPFLQPAFEQLGWMDNGVFKSEESQEDAAMFVGYLGSGKTEFPESTMTLVKLLCGIDLQTPLRSHAELSTQELGEAESLLAAAIGHWEKLGKAEPTQFREAFLMREGRISPNEFGWNLQIERQTFDILLEFLPWSIGMIRLPFMKTILTVNW